MTSLEEIKRLLSAATPRPWTVRVDSDGPSIVSESGDWIVVETQHGAEFLASKLNRLEKLEKVVDAAEVVSEEHGSECDDEWPLRVLAAVQALRQALEESK